MRRGRYAVLLMKKEVSTTKFYTCLKDGDASKLSLQRRYLRQDAGECARKPRAPREREAVHVGRVHHRGGSAATG